MIYIAGDIHATYERLLPEALAEHGVRVQPEDVLIVAGDFGIPWGGALADNDTKALKAIAKLPYTVAFIDGNHENFTKLYGFPVREWHGGKVHELLPNLLHLMRGEIFTLEGQTFFTMGGAASMDKILRTEGRSWWPEEIPTEEEWKNGYHHLEQVNYTVDYVITHTCPTYWKHLAGLSLHGESCPVSTRLDYLELKLHYKKWFFGHLHQDRMAEEKKDVWLYKNVFKIAKSKE